MYRLCTDFGTVPSDTQTWPDFGLEVLLRVIRNKEATALSIRWPDFDGISASARLLERNRPYGRLLKEFLP